MTLDEARSELLAAALTITTDTWTDPVFVRTLCDKATAYAAARSSSAPSRPAVASSGAVFPPYGTSKGQPIAGASQRDLEFYKRNCEKTLADPSKGQWHAKEQALLEAIDAEMSGR